MELSNDRLYKIILFIYTTKPHEIGCYESFEQLHHFAELESAGKDRENVFHLVQDYLNRC